MKKIRYIGLMAGLIILLNTNTKAQSFYTSYGYTQDWYLPSYIQYSITDHYYGYDIAHVRRYTRHGHPNFNILLHRNGWFVELRFDQHGHIYKTVKHRWHYPLSSHVCTAHCGYHHAYYKTYFPKYHHVHYYGPTHKTVYVNTHHSHKSNSNYYTNVYVDQQQKNTNINGNNQQRRTNQVIHKPQRTSNQQVVQNNSTSRIQRASGQERYNRPVTRTNGSNRTPNYRNERGNRNR